MNTITPKPKARRRESGFTLVEAMVAIVVLSFGLMAVTNLLLVAASSNSVANQGSAAVASATHAMDMLRNANYPGGFDSVGNPIVDDPVFGAIVEGGLPFAVNDGGPDCGVAMPADWHCTDSVPGVGSVHTHWYVTNTPGDNRLRYIRVRSEGTGALSAVRSRAEFTTFRACTTLSCPAAP
jgi:prepilin-type N-terminal cleavage/methylation domain-containing protein